MSFDWQTFYLVAKELEQNDAQDNLTDARLRSSMSRAYYSVFHLSRTFLEERRGKPKLGEHDNIHQYVIHEFDIGPDRQWKQIGNFLGKLRKYRNNADYEETIDNLPQSAGMALALAEKTLEILIKLQSGKR